MRRMRMFMLALAVVSLLIGPMPDKASAGPRDCRLVSLVSGNFSLADPIPSPTGGDPIEHRRTTTGEFTGVVIEGLIDVTAPEPELVQGRLEQPAGHRVTFTADDDALTAQGTINATDSTRAFRSPDAVEIRSGGVDPARVEVEIEGGAFERTGAVVVVRLDLNIRIDRNPGQSNEQEVVHCDRVPFEIVSIAVPSGPPPITGGTLVGVGASTHV